jgi:hypothetical protein
MILYILLAPAGVVAIILVAAAMQSSEFSVSRSILTSAPREAVFAQVNDLHRWQIWSPWTKLDLAAKNTYEGPAAGVGAVFAWDGNNKVGAGRMEIIDSRAPELIRFKLEFLRPMKATNIAEFTFKPLGNQTQVTWTMGGSRPFVGKVFGLFVNCDKMCGGMFEKGLADMTRLAESSAADLVTRG